MTESQASRFSLLYMPPPEQMQDCDRMRFRVARLLDDTVGDKDSDAGAFLERKLGIPVVSHAVYASSYVDWESFLGNADLADVLDTITLVYQWAVRSGRDYPFRRYVKDVERIFRERGMRFTVDENAIVHPYVDPAFEGVREATISGLKEGRYDATRAHIEASEKALVEKESRQAIRSIFDAVENLFKLMFRGVTQMNKQSINDKLRPAIEALYSPESGRTTYLKQCDSFRSWVDGAHPYRHAGGETVPTSPPRDLAILAVSQGYNWLRWLAQIDAALLEGETAD